MGTDTVTALVAKRRANVRNNRQILAPGRPHLPGFAFGALLGRSFGSLFSEVYGKENNCMSGIAMFYAIASKGETQPDVPRICHY
jgi:hypothetical protein